MKTAKIKQIAILTLFLFPFMIMGQESPRPINEIGPFTGVSSSGNIAVMLSQGEDFSVEIVTTKDQFDDVRARVRSNILVLDYTGHNRRPEDITVYVTAPEFTSLSASGAGALNSEHTLFSPELSLAGSGVANIKLAIDTELLTTDLSGASVVTLSGRALRHELKASGASLLNAFDLVSEDADCTLSGAANCKIHVINRIQANASGAARLEFRGSPVSKNTNTTSGARVTEELARDSSEAETGSDTIRVRVGQRELHVMEGVDHRTRVSVKRSRRNYFRNNWQGLELGVNGFLSPENSINLPVNSEQYDLDYRRSVAVNLNLMQKNLAFAAGHLGLVTGFGIGWNNYRFLTSDVLEKNNGKIEFVEGLHDFDKNRLTISRLNVPLLFEIQTKGNRASQRVHITAGVITGLRLGSHTKQVTKVDGKKERFRTKDDFHINPFHLDATASIGWGGSLSFFATYALNPLFKDGRGPELTPFTMGIRLKSN